MKAKFFVTIQGEKVGSYRKTGKVRVYKNKPSTGEDEIAVAVEIDIPNSIFEKPTLSIKTAITEPSEDPTLIKPEVQDNIAAIVKAQTGLSVRFEAPTEGE